MAGGPIDAPSLASMLEKVGGLWELLEKARGAEGVVPRSLQKAAWPCPRLGFSPRARVRLASSRAVRWKWVLWGAAQRVAVCGSSHGPQIHTPFHTFQSPGGTLSTGPGSAAGHSATSDFPVWCRKVLTNVDQVFSPDAGPERCLAVCALPPWARAAWQRPTEGRRPAPPECPGQALLVWAAKLFC